MQTTRYQLFNDGLIAVVTTRVARQGVTVETEEVYSVRAEQDPRVAIPYGGIRMAAENVVDHIVETREALMRCGYSSTCPVPNTLTVSIPGGKPQHVATVYGTTEGLGISGDMAEQLSRVLAAEGVKVRVD